MSKFANVLDATEENGNIFVLLGNAVSLLRQYKEPQTVIDALTDSVFSARNYEAALDAIREYFQIDRGD